MDGFYLSWDPASVSAGHYFKRLACSNGQTVRERHSDGMSHRLGEQEMRQMIGMLTTCSRSLPRTPRCGAHKTTSASH